MLADKIEEVAEALFHLCYQLELGAAAIEIVVWPVSAEVDVAVEVIGQESNATFQRHESGGKGQAVDFQRSEQFSSCIQVPG